MSSSSENRPSSTATRAAMAVTGLLIDAAWKRVASSTGMPVSTSAIPYPLAQCIWKSRITATLIPGTPNRSITSSMVRTSRPWRLGRCTPSMRTWKSVALSGSPSVAGWPTVGPVAVPAADASIRSARGGSRFWDCAETRTRPDASATTAAAIRRADADAESCIRIVCSSSSTRPYPPRRSPISPAAASGLRHEYDAQGRIERGAGEHADQRREHSPEDATRAGTGCSFGHCSVSRRRRPPIIRLTARRTRRGCSPGSDAAPASVATGPSPCPPRRCSPPRTAGRRRRT